MKRGGRIARNALIMALLAGAVWYFIFRQIRAEELKLALTGAKPWALVLAVGMMAIYFLADAYNTARGLRHLGYQTSILSCLQYAAAGFFFSAVTPSASGGQPMQLYYMQRRKIDAGHGALVLLLELACWQIVSVLYGAIGLIAGWAVFSEVSPAVRVLAAVGIGLNLVTLSMILAAMLAPQFVRKIADKLFVKMTKHPRLQRVCAFVQMPVMHFAEGAPVLRSSPKLLLKMLLTTALQLAAIYSVPFFVHRALGLHGWSLPAVAAVQAVVSLSVSSLPLPGAMGVGENGFLTAFRMLFPASLLSSAMVLSRGVSFYLCVVLAGMTLGVEALYRLRRGHRKKEMQQPQVVK